MCRASPEGWKLYFDIMKGKAKPNKPFVSPPAPKFPRKEK